jgi:uncharacterized membrane protein
MLLFGVFWGVCDVNSCTVFMLLVMALWVPISATLFRRAWHAFMFLGLRFIPLFAWWPLAFSLKKFYFIINTTPYAY